MPEQEGKMIKTIVAALVMFFTVLTFQAQAMEKMDPLLRILIKKGVLTREEALEVQKEAKQLAAEEKAVSATGSGQVPSELKGLKDVKFGMLTYLNYSTGKEPASGGESSFGRFKITRGYVTLKKKIAGNLRARVTTDVHQDSTGDWKIRLKYLYAEMRPKDIGFFTNMKAEAGLGHIPWLDFEEHVNPYRCQGTMAIERARVFNSADMGLSIRGNLGGTLDDPQGNVGNAHYAGKYGGWHLGVYNGGGYHASENNSNKVLEGRVTVRPLPDLVPGLQFSYLGIYGEGNTAYNGEYPDYRVNLGMVSFQHPRLILTAQYFQTTGNAKGSWVKTTAGGGIDTELKTKGYSFFGNFKLPVFEDRLNLFSRYDHFDPDSDGVISGNADYDMYLGGLAYELGRGDMILATYETTDYESGNAGKGELPVAGTNLGDDYKFQMVYQFKF